uniref:Uncharacterized protein n=1 Tax=Parascaris equorum TaxID=6256 RepID=A0A914R1Y1_PAREQ
LFLVPTSGCTINALGSNLVVIGGWNPHHFDPWIRSHDHGYVRKIYKHNLYTRLWSEHRCYIPQENCPIETACHCTFQLTSNTLLFFGGSMSPMNVSESSNKVFIYSMK